MTDEPLPIPHRCGALCDFCILREEYRILFCAICRQVVGFEKDGVRFIRNFQEKQYKKKEFSKDIINDSV